MTLNEVYLNGKNILIKAGIENPAFDAMCIFKLCFKLNRQDIILYRNKTADNRQEKDFFNLIKQRSNGRPLQYILGEWSFMDLKFNVGEGVLIPRDDTEVLVNAALNLIKHIKNPKILDLCSGSGTIALSLAYKRPDADVKAIELSDIALKYLNENIKLNNINNVVALKGDVLTENVKNKFIDFDIIVSNPPYIPTSDIDNLQKEVKNEPIMALDGGDDGLNFYRIIAKKWKVALRKNGMMCFEIGIKQAKDVACILKNENADEIKTIKDLNGIDRVITAKF